VIARRASIALTALALAALLAACGEKTVEADRAEETVTEFVSAETGFDPTDMECPEDVEATEGESFECTFTGPEGPYVADVTIESVDGDDARFAIETRRAD
jgi:hypothetical protein